MNMISILSENRDVVDLVLSVALVIFLINAVVWTVIAFKKSEEPPAQELKFTESGTPVLLRHDPAKYARLCRNVSIAGAVIVIVFKYVVLRMI